MTPGCARSQVSSQYPIHRMKKETEVSFRRDNSPPVGILMASVGSVWFSFSSSKKCLQGKGNLAACEASPLCLKGGLLCSYCAGFRGSS